MFDLDPLSVNARQAAQEAQELVLEYAKTSGRPLPVLKHVIEKVETDDSEGTPSVEELVPALAATAITE